MLCAESRPAVARICALLKTPHVKLAASSKQYTQLLTYLKVPSHITSTATSSSCLARELTCALLLSCAAARLAACIVHISVLLQSGCVRSTRGAACWRRRRHCRLPSSQAQRLVRVAVLLQTCAQANAQRLALWLLVHVHSRPARSLSAALQHLARASCQCLNNAALASTAHQLYIPHNITQSQHAPYLTLPVANMCILPVPQALRGGCCSRLPGAAAAPHTAGAGAAAATGWGGPGAAVCGHPRAGAGL